MRVEKNVMSNLFFVRHLISEISPFDKSKVRNDKINFERKIMSTEKVKEIINQYFDNELNKSEEIFLFTQLSQNEEARNYFKEMNLLNSVIKEGVEEFPQNLDEKIFSKLKNETQIPIQLKNYNKLFNYMTYGFALLLLALSFFFYNESMQYRNKLELSFQQINQQNQMIQVLFNTLPQAEVKAKVEDLIVVTSNM